jgi:hypothetical protein
MDRFASPMTQRKTMPMPIPFRLVAVVSVVTFVATAACADKSLRGRAQSPKSDPAGGTSPNTATSSRSVGIACKEDAPPTPQLPGTWRDVTPRCLNLAATQTGAQTVLVDVVRPSDVYVNVQKNGTWKSTDYGSSWKKVSNGTNGDKLDSGSQWYAAIDTNPKRDPATPPTLYVTQGYGVGGVWKSVDGGVNWTDVWTNNVFGPDGANVSSDVGNDIHSVQLVDSTGSDHLLVTMHGPPPGKTGNGNTGIFESTDGGRKWILRKSSLFKFAPHSDILYALDAKTWFVGAGTVSPGYYMYRTTDGGASWKPCSGDLQKNIGRSIVRTRDAIYSGTDYASGVYKSVDGGWTWAKVPNSGGNVSWVAATPTNLYIGDSSDAGRVRRAPLAHDDTSTVMSTPPGIVENGHDANVIFDGSHHVLIVAEHKSGIWRYVEP